MKSDNYYNKNLLRMCLYIKLYILALGIYNNYVCVWNYIFHYLKKIKCTKILMKCQNI